MSVTSSCAAGRLPVSVVCVFNNPSVLRECLSASVEAGLAAAPETEFLPIDNTSGQFSSAGGALNHGASLARNEVLVFVHQDVVLHSLPALEKVAHILASDPALGVLGAVGMTHRGRLIGLIRDRVFLSGERNPGLVDVDSLDEVLFMVRRQQLILHPLAEDRDLSWHAYSVEYGMRVRSLGMRVVVADIPLTHNSLTINLERLAEAHRWIAETYPEMLPVVTTCGTVRTRTRPRAIPLAGRLFQNHKWRFRWLRESLKAHRLRKLTDTATVLGDLRVDIDEICSAARLREAIVISGLPAEMEDLPIAQPLTLNRREVRFRFQTTYEASMASLVASYPPDQTVVVTNISFRTARKVADGLTGRRVLLGFHNNMGAWLLTGPAVEAAHSYYRKPRSIPFAMTPN